MPLSFWFWLCFFLAVVGGAFAGWGSGRGWGWGWGVPLVLVLIMLAVLAMKIFGGPISG